MIININGIKQSCHRCGSDDLLIINYDEYEETYIVWCNKCEEQTMEDVLKTNQIKGVNFWVN